MNILKTILSWQPWKIAVTAVSSVAVVSGAATGVGVTIAHNVNEQETDSAYVSESNQDTPVFAPVESGTEIETETQTQPQTQPSTQAPPSTTPTTEPTTQEKITWTYDEKLSKELGKLIEAKFPGYKYDSSLFEERGPGHYINNGIIKEQNEDVLYIGNITPGNDIAKKLLNAWTQVDIKQLSKKNSSSFCIAVYKYSNGYYFISAC